MSRKVLLIYRVDKSQKANIGVIKKLIGQIDGFTYHNVKTDYIIHDDKHIYLNNKVIYKIKPSASKTYFKWRFFDCLPQEILSSYTHIIIRHGVVTLPLLNFLKITKKTNSATQIIIDMPTYPYSKEWVGVRGISIMYVDRVLRLFLKKYVSNILHSGKETKIFEIPTIQFSNGINLENIKEKSPKVHNGQWVFLAIGKWQYWHGLDRLIEGLMEYVKIGRKNVRIKIVGTGPIEKDLKNLVRDFNLSDYFDFQGVLTGVDLDKIFNDSDIGIGTLGLFRKGVVIDSSLKHREYAGRGLPFVLAGEDSDFSDELSFVHQVPANEEPIDIGAIVRFLEQSEAQVISKAARAYAQKHLTWRMKMKRLLESSQFRE